MKTGIFPLVGDLLHPGHIVALNKARRHCDHLIVLLNCKPDNKEPIETVYERWVRLYSLSVIDEIIPYSGEADLLNAIKTIDHQVRFLGSDYNGQKEHIYGDDILVARVGYATGEEWERDHDIEIVYIDRDHNWSSTELKNRIKNTK